MFILFCGLKGISGLQLQKKISRFATQTNISFHTMKLYKGLFLTTFFSFPFMTEGRETQSINDSWLFTQNDKTVAVHLPHSWNSDAYSSAEYYRGNGTYTRALHSPEGAEGKRIFLRLDGAAYKSKIFIDGIEVGNHVGGFSSHILDITPYLSDGLGHELRVEVDNSDPAIPPYSADYSFMGGLYRDVSVIVTDPVYLDFTEGPAEGFKITPGKRGEGLWELNVKGKIKNTSSIKKDLKIEAVLLDASGKAIAEKSRKLTINPSSSNDFTLKIDDIRNPDLWSPEESNLYTVEVKLVSGGKVLDETVASTGFRTFGFDTEGRFLLNGKPYKLRGMCRHQDQAPMGIALIDEMHRRDIKMIHDMGANFLRISHYPQDDAILEMCDRLGLIVWEEIPVIDYVPETEYFDDNAEIMAREMVQRHYNHPSIAMWGYMNEILLRVPGENREETYERTRQLAEQLEKAVREEDATRMTTMAFHGSDVYHEAGLSELTDIKGWNLYQGWYGGELNEFEKFLSRQHNEHPEHRLIVSEYGAGSDRRLHSLQPEPFDFSMEYQQDYLEHYLPVIEDSAYVAGASHWNFIDFSSAKRAESMPHINNKGLVTNGRVPKDIYHYYRAYWHDNDTVAHIATEDWSYRREVPDSDGNVIRPIKVYTNLPEIAMRVNGNDYGLRPVENRTGLFDINLSNGKNIIEVFDREGRLLDSKSVTAEIFNTANGRFNLDKDELAINVGSNCYFQSDDSGMVWLPDYEFGEGKLYGHTGGKRVTTQDEILLTADQPLLQRALQGVEEYKIMVEPGNYEVELLFAEQGKPSVASAYMLGHNAGTGAEWSMMDIQINGKEVESNFSPGDTAGPKTMVRRRYTTKVDNDTLSIRFGGSSSLAGLKVRKL